MEYQPVPEVYDWTYNPFRLTVPVTINSTGCLSIVWYCSGPFEETVNVILDGKIIASDSFVNKAWLQARERFKLYGNLSGFYKSIVSSLSFLLVNNLTRTEQGSMLWQINQQGLKYLDDLTGENVSGYTNEHLQEFIDTLQIVLEYPGEDHVEIAGLYFPGAPVNRVFKVYYANGSYTHPQLGQVEAGYEGIASYTIAAIKVTDEILREWLNRKPVTPGAMKAAYGTGLAALELIYLHDRIAEEAAAHYNVTWTRTRAVAVSVVDTADETYMTLECSHNMGVVANGAPENIKAFNYARTSAINGLEFFVMQRLFPVNTTDLDTIMSQSIITNIAYKLLNGEKIDVRAGNYTIIGYDNDYLVIDSATGILRDVRVFNSIYGAYCFSHLQTEWASELAKELLNGSGWFEVVADSCLMAATCVFEDAFPLLASNPAGLAILALIIDLYWIVEQPEIAVPLNLAWMPIFGQIMSYYAIKALISGESPSNLVEKDQETFLEVALLLLELAKNDDFQEELLETLNRGGNIQEVFDRYAPGGLRDPGDRWDKVGQYFREACSKLKSALKNRDVKGVLVIGSAIVGAFTATVCALEDALIKPVYEALEKIRQAKEEEAMSKFRNNTKHY
ncbi:hypothetical protein [Methanothermobacter sp.]|uniref:hypothetical protein n=1 Tax=Methanothermobacter sp. TaxID=1884223 RepID=UPI003C773431